MRPRLLLIIAMVAAAAAMLAPATAQAKSDLKARMTGAQIVGSSGAPEGRGRGRFDVFARKHKFCFDVSFHKIGGRDGLNIGIYKGKSGVNGNEVIQLEGEKTTSPIQGCIHHVRKTLLKDIKQHPQHYHINVKNERFDQNGAIRGQLKRAGG